MAIDVSLHVEEVREEVNSEQMPQRNDLSCVVGIPKKISLTAARHADSASGSED